MYNISTTAPIVAADMKILLEYDAINFEKLLIFPRKITCALVVSHADSN